MDNFYNRKEDMIEIIKENGGENFFNELNAARIPFFFITAVENTRTETEYLCKAITPSSMGIHLTIDKFNDFLNIRNKGFVSVPSMEEISPSIQGLKRFDAERQKDGKCFYKPEVLAKFNAENGVKIEDGSVLTDEMDGYEFSVSQTALNVLNSVMYNLSGEPSMGCKPSEEGTEQICVQVFHDQPLVIEWGCGEQKPQTDYRDEFAQIDKRHENILKGDGSFLKIKEQEAVYYNVEQKPEIYGKWISEEKEGLEEPSDTRISDVENP